MHFVQEIIFPHFKLIVGYLAKHHKHDQLINGV